MNKDKVTVTISDLEKLVKIDKLNDTLEVIAIKKKLALLLDPEATLTVEEKMKKVQGRDSGWIRDYAEIIGPLTTSKDKIALEIISKDVPWMLQTIDILQARINILQTRINRYQEDAR